MKKSFFVFTNSVAIVATAFSLALPLAFPEAAQAQTSASGFCYTFNHNMGEGLMLSSADASALQQALTAQGFWSSGAAITVYTDAVASAVVGFQQKYASAILTPNGLTYGTGYVGVSTRAELNALYGCSSTTMPTSPVQCPAGYTCVPNNQKPAPVCPSGYTCTPTNSTVPTIPVTVPVTSTPVTSAGAGAGSTPAPLSLGTAAYFSLAAVPTITRQNSSMSLSGNSTSTYTAGFNVQVTTVNTVATLGLQNADTPFVVPNYSVSIFKNSSNINGHYENLSEYNPTIAWSQPAGTTLSSDGTTFTVGPNQTVNIPVTVSFPVEDQGAAVYAVALRGIDWVSSDGSVHYVPLSGQLGVESLMTSPI